MLKLVQLQLSLAAPIAVLRSISEIFSSIETRSAPALTHVLPLISTFRFSHLCRPPPGGSIRSLLPSQLYLLSRKSLSSIPALLLSCLDFSRPESPVMDEAVRSDGASVWDGISGLEWVLA